MNAVLAFWIAYILTRPFGASIGDYLSQPKADGGLGLGTVVTSALFLTAILAVVVFLTITRRDETPAQTVSPEELQPHCTPHLHVPHPHVPHPHVPTCISRTSRRPARPATRASRENSASGAAKGAGLVGVRLEASGYRMAAVVGRAHIRTGGHR